MDLVKIRVLKRWPGGSYDVGHKSHLPKAFALKLAERGVVEILREVPMETKAVGKPAVPPPATPTAEVEPGKGKDPSAEKSTKPEVKASAPVPAPPAPPVPPAAPPAAEGFLATMKKKLPWQK